MKNENLPSQFKKYISIIDLMKSKNSQQKMPMSQIAPDLFLFSKYKIKHIINFFCQYLSEEETFDFIGENKILNIKLQQINGENSVSGICDKINDMFILSGSFRGRFKGIIIKILLKFCIQKSHTDVNIRMTFSLICSCVFHTAFVAVTVNNLAFFAKYANRK